MNPRLLFCLLWLPTAPLFAQTDSVIVSGQVRRLSARLYRASPNVLVTRTNILRGGTELAFPAPLQPDGRFRVAVPIIYPQEEMQFIVGNIGTAFLASAGKLTIDAENDSLRVAAVPFQFGGVNAQVNQQFAQYKAFEAKNTPAEATRKRTMRRALDGGFSEMYSSLYQIFTSALTQFSARQPVFPLVSEWVQANARYGAAAYVFDKVIQEGQAIPGGSFLKTMTTGSEGLLTASRATALDRFGAYASMRIAQNTPGGGRGIRVGTLARLLERYGVGLTNSDRMRLAAFQNANTAKTTDVRYLSRLMERNPDTLSRLVLYENAMHTARPLFDSLSVDYLKAFAMTSTISDATLDVLGVLGRHIGPQIGNTYLKQSLDDVLGQALRDTEQVRRAWGEYLGLSRKPGINSGFVGDGIYVTSGANREGDELVKKAIDQNRGRVIYVVLWSPDSEQGRELARDVQRLRDVFPPRDLTVLYVCLNDENEKLWLESLVRNRLKGEHVRLTQEQTNSAFNTLSLDRQTPARLITPQGKLVKKEALLPDKFEQLVEQIRSLLR